MKHWKRLPALLLSGALSLSLCACNSGGSTESPEPSPEASGDPQTSASPAIQADLSQSALEFSAGLSPDDVLLTVNGEDVKADVFCYLLGNACAQVQQNLYLYYGGASLSDLPNASAQLLERGVQLSVYHTLARQKAAELGCLLTDAQRAEIKTMMEETDLEHIAPLWDLSGEGIQFAAEMNYYSDNLLDAVTHEPSAQELDEYLASQGVFAVKHILLMTVDQTTQEPLSEAEIAGKKAKAEDLLAQLQGAEDMPAKFDELMQANSEDGGLAANPDGYVFTKDDSLVGGFREAALELEEGEMSGIVETDYGYHIMLRLPLTDETKGGYQMNYRSDALDEQMEQWVEESEVTRADVLTDFDTLGFFDRLAAYQQALSAQQAAGAPVESGAVG